MNKNHVFCSTNFLHSFLNFRSVRMIRSGSKVLYPAYKSINLSLLKGNHVDNVDDSVAMTDDEIRGWLGLSNVFDGNPDLYNCTCSGCWTSPDLMDDNNNTEADLEVDKVRDWARRVFGEWRCEAPLPPLFGIKANLWNSKKSTKMPRIISSSESSSAASSASSSSSASCSPIARPLKQKRLPALPSPPAIPTNTPEANWPLLGSLIKFSVENDLV